MRARLGKLLRIKPFLFVRLNFLSRNINRKKGKYIIPLKGAVVQISSKATINMEGHILLGYDQPQGGNTETRLRMEPGSVWEAKDNVTLFADSFLDIKKNARFKSGKFGANGTVIVIKKHMRFGNDVQFGRNVVVYDSDFHTIYADDGITPINYAADVIIEDHVWLTGNITISKGVTIGKDSVIGQFSLVNKNIPEKSFAAGVPCKRLGASKKWEYVPAEGV